ncbi:MAG: hypothetical protein HZB23_10690 [Deltaproteobacteria bacterium]|nr:hypothetical protein [Deltaproteobacteria bacterium]
MADWDVGRAYASLADTITQGVAGLGRAQNERAELGLKKAQIETEAALFDKYERPRREAELAELQMENQPFAGNLWGDDPLDQAHAATDFLGDFSEVMQADFDPKTKRWKYRNPVSTDRQFVSNGDMKKRFGGRLAAIMAGKTNVGRKLEDDHAKAVAGLSAAESEEALTPGANAPSSGIPSGNDPASPNVGANDPRSIAAAFSLPGANDATGNDPRTSSNADNVSPGVQKAKARLAEATAKRKAYAADPLPFEQKRLDLLYDLRSQAVANGWGPDSLGTIDVNINRVSDEVKRLRDLPGSNRETRPVGYWASLLTPEAKEKFLAHYKGDTGKLVIRAEAIDVSTAIGAQIEDGRTRKPVKQRLSEGGLTKDEQAAIKSRYPNLDYLPDAKEWGEVVNEVRDRAKETRAIAQRDKERRQSKQDRLDEIAAQGRETRKNVDYRAANGGGGYGGSASGKHPKSATLDGWIKEYGFGPAAAAQFKALFPGAGTAPLSAATVQAAFKASPYFNGTIEKRVSGWESDARKAWGAMDEVDRAAYSGGGEKKDEGKKGKGTAQSASAGYAKFRESFIPAEELSADYYGRGADTPPPSAKPTGKAGHQPDVIPADEKGYERSQKEARTEMALKKLPRSVAVALGRNLHKARKGGHEGEIQKAMDAILNYGPQPVKRPAGMIPVGQPIKG